MSEQIATTPFGRRPLTFAQIATRKQLRTAMESAGKPGSNVPSAVNKWALYRTLTEIKERLGLSDRSLSVLNALLSFQQETALSLPLQAEGDAEATSCDLVVFPSNKALRLRAHGMSESTLRRHLAALVAAGLILRRDSSNGKRFARKDQSGRDRFADAFGFDLAPLVIRAAEFEATAEQLRADRRTLTLIKERIVLHRRDVSKMIACGLDGGVEAAWAEFSGRFMELLKPVRHMSDPAEAQAIEAQLSDLRRDLTKLLECHAEKRILTGSDVHFEQHISNSNTKPLSIEPVSDGSGGEIQPNPSKIAGSDDPSVRLGMVLEACPDILNFHFEDGSVEGWPAFVRLAASVRPMLGISSDAWREAIAAMGERNAAVSIAAILQRSEHSSRAIAGASGGSMTVDGSPAIRSPGGYLRALTEKALGGEFSVAPFLMALLAQRSKQRRPGGTQRTTDGENLVS